MCGALASVFNLLTSVDWLEVIRSFAPAGTAVIAFFALQNWKRQDKAKREIEFLDGMLDGAHAYILELYKPIILWRLTKTAMISFAPAGAAGDETSRATQGAPNYVQRHGAVEGRRLFEALEAIQPSLSKLKSLQAKGQVFQFEGYAKAYNALELLAWHYSRFEALAFLISSQSLNFAHPEVNKLLADLVAIEPDQVEKNIAEANKALIEFAQAAYRQHYGGPPKK